MLSLKLRDGKPDKELTYDEKFLINIGIVPDVYPKETVLDWLPVLLIAGGLIVIVGTIVLWINFVLSLLAA